MSTLYLDIETAPVWPTFADMPEDGKAAFTKKFEHEIVSGKYPDLQACYEGEASFYAEFSKIICVGLGSVVIDKNDENKEKIYLKALIGREIDILKEFAEVLVKTSTSKICAHRGKQFDFPFMGRRFLINKMQLPPILNIKDKKPWEVPWEDTAEFWQFNDRKHYVSLITLAYVFGIPSPKQTLDGSKVAAAYRAGQIQEIKAYCLEDTYTLVQIDRAQQCKTLLPRFGV